jgi:GNAT superfamily N-acetyltransferase
MYDSLSEESKSFFNPGFLGYKNISLFWLLTQIALLLSCIKFLRKVLLCVFPYSVFLPLVAVKGRNRVCGFAFLARIKKCPNDGYSGRLGIVVHDADQGKGLGSRLIEVLLKFAQAENIRKISLMVYIDNIKAIRLYEKYGFKRIGQVTSQIIMMEKLI